MFKEFRDFLTRGNLIEIAVGLVMALAFTSVVTALVDGLIMPLVAAIFGEPSFDDLTFELNGSVFAYGTFITAVVKFVLMAAAIFFLIVKPVNAMIERASKRKQQQQA